MIKTGTEFLLAVYADNSSSRDKYSFRGELGRLLQKNSDGGLRHNFEIKIQLYCPGRVNKILTVDLKQVERKVAVDAPEPTNSMFAQWWGDV
jgi:hypothetical protein